MNMKLRILLLGICLLFNSVFGAPLVKSGNKVAFLGDSITQGGWSNKEGYVRLVYSGLKTNGIDIVPIPAGISGNKSNQMLNRVERDVIDKGADFMLLSCGVNDVWHGTRGNNLETFSKNITDLIEKVQTAKIKPIILTATMIYEDPKHRWNLQLDAYNDFLRKFAAKRNIPLIDLNADMKRIIAEKVRNNNKSGTLLTTDGVHMNPIGNIMMAKGILRGLGLTHEEVARAERSWLESQGKLRIQLRVALTLAEYIKLEEAAEREGKSINEYINGLILR